MISLRCVKSYCCEDISLIENYDKAINDTTQTWSCHHRLEIDMNLSYEELKEKNLYYNRPASELIFMTRSEHSSLHRLNSSEETKKKRSKSMKIFWETHEHLHQSEERRKRQSEIMKKWHSTHENPMKGKTPYNKKEPDCSSSLC